MADEVTTTTEPTPTTTETTTALGAGLEKAADQGKTNESTTALGAALDAIKTEGGADKDASSQTLQGAPEKYADFKLPDGYDLDAGMAEKAGGLFKEMNLSQEQAQKLVDFYATEGIKSFQEREKSNMDFWADTRKGWREEIKADPVLGKLAGEDGNFSVNSPLVTTINRALDGLQDPKLKAAFKEGMELTGAGDHPAFVRVLYALASKVTEGTSYVRGEPSKEGLRRPSAAASMYPNLKSEATLGTG